MILFGLYSGQRLGDIAKLTWWNRKSLARSSRTVANQAGEKLAIV